MLNRERHSNNYICERFPPAKLTAQKNDSIVWKSLKTRRGVIVKVLFLKYVINGLVAQTLELQLTNNYDYIYNTQSRYKAMITNFFENENEIFDIIIFGYSKEERKIVKFWAGKCSLFDTIDNKILIQNAYELDQSSGMEIMSLYQKEFDERPEDVKSYVFKQDLNGSDKDQFNHILNSSYLVRKKEECEYNVGIYATLKEMDISEFVKETEKQLHVLAQKSIFARRPLGIKRPAMDRSEYQRDRERVVHAKAFRRMVDKAQIYTSAKGDHYRTRLTHSLEVNQIARALARTLNLNEDLAEAIALAHDIGHTPFGHEGERELGNIMSGKIQLSREHTPKNLGGFKHNFQSIRTLNYLEEKYPEYEGLDLTYQVLEGVLKHTKIRKCRYNYKNETDYCPNCVDKCFDINEFLKIGDSRYLYLEYDFPTTLEGQIVAAADEIAQRGHDLDDGIASGVLNIDELIKDFKMNRLDEFVQILDESNQEIEVANRQLIGERDMLRGVIVSRVISFFMQRLVEQARKNMNSYMKKIKDNGVDFVKNPVVTEKLIEYHSKDQTLMETLEKLITQKVINSQEVNCFDGKSAYVVRKLFKAYYSNPRQLPDGAVRRIEREIYKYTQNAINIRTGFKVENEIKIYRGIGSSGNKEEDAIKQKIFMRCVADLIGGMTDQFANEQFKKLYIP